MHETAITLAECDRRGQRSVYNMGQFSSMGGTKVGPTIQEADWFYLVDASAEIKTTDHLVAMDQVVKEVNEVATQHRIRACGRFAVTRQQKEETGYKKPAWVLDR